MWLRLQRIGNQFTGYAGFDGQSWSLLGTVNLAMQPSIYFGFAVSSHNASQTAPPGKKDSLFFGNLLSQV